MANLEIIDSGYVNVDEDGEQETLQANVGTGIELRGVDLNYQRGQGLDDAPIPATEASVTVNPVSVTNPIITVNGILSRTSTTDMNMIILFDTLARSKGVKLLYYSSTDADISGGSATDGWANVITKLGAENMDGTTNQALQTVVDAHTASGGQLYNEGDPYPHLHVYVKSLRIAQSATKNYLNYTLTLEVSL